MKAQSQTEEFELQVRNIDRFHANRSDAGFKIRTKQITLMGRDAHGGLIHEVHIEVTHQLRISFMSRHGLHPGAQAMIECTFTGQAAHDPFGWPTVMSIDNRLQPHALHAGRVTCGYRVIVSIRTIKQVHISQPGLRRRGGDFRQRPRANQGDLRFRSGIRSQAGEFRKHSARGLILLQQQGRAGLVPGRPSADPENRQRSHQHHHGGDQPVVPQQDLEQLAQMNGVIGHASLDASTQGLAVSMVTPTVLGLGIAHQTPLWGCWGLKKWSGIRGRWAPQGSPARGR